MQYFDCTASRKDGIGENMVNSDQSLNKDLSVMDSSLIGLCQGFEILLT